MERTKNQVQVNNGSAPGFRQQIEVIYYTDPICCWSWSFEPQWRKLLYEFEGQLQVRYCMGGLLRDWSSFHDAVNCISCPVQMGPVWMQAAHISGMPMHNRLWIEDPPASSYLACIAVKAANLQSAAAGVEYLRAAREAVMMHGVNIARFSALVKIAEVLAAQQPGLLNISQFKNDIVQHRAKQAFQLDLEELRLKNITRLPTLLFRYPGKPSLMMAGYRSYNDLLEILQQLLPGITKAQQADKPELYAHYWKNLTSRELEEISR